MHWKDVKIGGVRVRSQWGRINVCLAYTSNAGRLHMTPLITLIKTKSYETTPKTKSYETTPKRTSSDIP